MRPYHSIRLELQGVAFLLQAEPLEHRTLLSGSSVAQAVAIQVPSTYVSQQADQLNVTLVRTAAAGHSRNLGPVTLDFSATDGSLPAGSAVDNDDVGQQFTPVNESVTFPAGVTTETVVVPINSGAPNPGAGARAAQRHFCVAQGARQRRDDLSRDQPRCRPAIDRRRAGVAGGIAVTFSKPMDPTTVENIHNYAVKFSPSQKFSLDGLDRCRPGPDAEQHEATDRSQTSELRRRHEHRHAGSE